MTKRAFTLIELLLVIAIIAVLLAILLPSLSAARETANIAYCMSNLGQITKVSEMYMDDENRRTQPWYLDTSHISSQIQVVSEYVYGGYQHTRQNPDFPDSDTYHVPTRLRPYNKYIAPGFHGRSPIKAYLCPSDKTYYTPLVGGEQPDQNQYGAFSSWQVNGNSYAINWYWLEGPPWYGEQSYYGSLASFSLAGEQLLNAKVGGEAAKFVMFMESGLNMFAYEMRPRSGLFGPSLIQWQIEGWHRKFSSFSVGFLDGHAEFHYFDTRYADGDTYTLWPTYHF